MKDLDEMFAKNKSVVQNATPPAELDGRIAEASGIDKIRAANAKNAVPGEKKPVVRILEYSLAAVAVVLIFVLMTVILPHRKPNTGVSAQKSETAGASATGAQISPSPLVVTSDEKKLPYVYDLTYLLRYTGVQNYNYDNLAEVVPDFTLLIGGYLYQNQNKMVVDAKKYDTGKYNYFILGSSMQYTAEYFYGDQVRTAPEKYVPLSKTPSYIYLSNQNIYTYYAADSPHSYDPYILESTETADTITATVAFIRFSGAYNDYSGTYYNERDEVLGTMPKNAMEPLTLEQVKAGMDSMEAPLLKRTYVIKKRTDGSMWIQSCHKLEPGSIITPSNSPIIESVFTLDEQKRIDLYVSALKDVNSKVKIGTGFISVKLETLEGINDAAKNAVMAGLEGLQTQVVSYDNVINDKSKFTTNGTINGIILSAKLIEYTGTTAKIEATSSWFGMLGASSSTYDAVYQNGAWTLKWVGGGGI